MKLLHTLLVVWNSQSELPRVWNDSYADMLFMSTFTFYSYDWLGSGCGSAAMSKLLCTTYV
jgi:hypothetical protein